MTKGLRSPNCERWKFIRGAPFLLRRDPETLEANLYSLAALLRIDRDEALKMVRTMPVLLAYSCRGLEQKFEALARALGERDGRVAAIQRPTLLGLSPDTIERRHARLRAVADKVPCWSSPESQEAIPRCLVRAERNYVRLEDVAAHFAPLGSVDHAMETLLSCPAWRWRMTKYFAALPEEVQSKYDGDDKAAFRHRLSATKPQPGRRKGCKVCPQSTSATLSLRAGPRDRVSQMLAPRSRRAPTPPSGANLRHR